MTAMLLRVSMVKWEPAEKLDYFVDMAIEGFLDDSYLLLLIKD